MTQEELDKIVEQHQHWLKEDWEGWEDMRADLSGANLRGANLSKANLHGADLSGANLRGANLSKANLCWADLRGANLCEADLCWADLRGANLCEADLCWADLRGANLCEADLRGADLSRANLSKANLSGANLSEANLSEANLSEQEKIRLGKVLDDPLTGYKKTKEGVVITAEIPAGAIVFCINGSKCRTNRATITDMDGHEVLHSQFDNSFEYRLGQEINIKDFNLMYNLECASGFHFFRTREEAEGILSNGGCRFRRLRRRRSEKLKKENSRRIPFGVRIDIYHDWHRRGHDVSRAPHFRDHEGHSMKRKPENQVFHFGLEKVALKDLDLSQAHKAKEYAHAMANGYGLNDDARMQNYWIGVENCVDAKICELERA